MAGLFCRIGNRSAGKIVGWRVSISDHAGFVHDVLAQAAHDRRPVRAMGTPRHLAAAEGGLFQKACLDDPRRRLVLLRLTDPRHELRGKLLSFQYLRPHSW